MELPEECWESIFSFLEHHRYFEPLSLVCHRFLSITNHLRRTLVVTDLTLESLPRLLLRFPNLHSIIFRDFHGNLNSVLSLISQSGLPLESLDVSNQMGFPLLGLKRLSSKMGNLIELKCSKIGTLKDSDLIEVGKCFPFLEVVDISYPDHGCDLSPNGSLDSRGFSGLVTDYGILGLASRLRRLRKIDLSGNPFITDQALVSLTLNCLFLSEIGIRDCDFITQNGIALAMRKNGNLKSVSMNGIGIPSIDACFKDSFAYARGLCDLDLSNSFISDEFLYLLAEACLPLNKLVLSRCYCFTFDGISVLLSKYHSLTHLDLEGANFLNDESMIESTKFLGNLTFINLSLCSKLTNSTFFSLIRNCPLLSIINMERTNLGLEEFPTEIVVNPRVRSLYLAWNNSLNDECLERVAHVCPNLEMLDVTYCSGITEKGILGILKSCWQIRCLEINRCEGIKNLEIDFELPKLEVLEVEGLGIDDEALTSIGKRCSRLLHLNLEGCPNVTSRGVEGVVGSCKLLKEINLRWCNNLSADIAAWMVFSRPSLRKITLPCGSVPSVSQRTFFLRHGCLLCQG
ncbi:Leucine-rich repeat, cysteine-containing subtype [Corchorus capsularis]|uniref:Leucine-rich repeat, cysteine-containing subtype n=1 Tax=Corchorus capsularis TaxID=210143 RepID=A0A1R3G4D4_COCAP|nr:Leucine-rich repeat, cysteine-containing subtype [Corchorus capsularis]